MVPCFFVCRAPHRCARRKQSDPGKNDQSGIKGKHFRLCYVIIDRRGSKNWRSTQPSRLMLYFAQRRSGLMPVMRAEE
jgi:hypothetical protein